MHIRRNISIMTVFLKTRQTFTICKKKIFIKLQNVCEPYMDVKWMGLFFSVFINHFLKIHRSVLCKITINFIRTPIYEKKIMAKVRLTRQKQYFLLRISRQIESLRGVSQKQLFGNVAFLHLSKPGEMPVTDFILVVYLSVHPACYFTKG